MGSTLIHIAKRYKFPKFQLQVMYLSSSIQKQWVVLRNMNGNCKSNTFDGMLSLNTSDRTFAKINFKLRTNE